MHAASRHPCFYGRCAALARVGIGALAGSLALPIAALAGEPFPLPGHYRLDMETTTTSSAGAMTLERTAKVDGSNGVTTSVSRATGSPPTPPQVYAGQGPVRHCIPAGGDSAAKAASAARRLGASCVQVATPIVDGDSARYTVQCAGMTQEVQTRRLAETTWEIRTTSVAQASGGGAAAMPAATVAAMAPVVARMEERLRSNPPEAEAEAIRQQLQALRGGAGSAGNAGSASNAGSALPTGATRTVIVQRYTKIADTCS